MTPPFPLPANTPAFRLDILNNAARVILAAHPSLPLVDVLAVRGNDRVYVTTIPKP